jgi:geranylgeranyl diphosphate synthase, type I
LFNQLAQRYLGELDATMRQIVASIPDTPDFGVMLRYPFGWVDQNNQPYNRITGKRIRPLLLLLCTEVASGNWRTALPAASAVEILHNFSLVHDDIQDNSPVRHGRPTVWKIWGHANAINVGDALFGLSYCALEELNNVGLSAEVTLEAWHIFNQTVQELTRGQHLDMRFEKLEVVSVDDYLSMITGKSAALVAACAQIGALIATGNREAAQLYAEFGLNLGLAFQIRDDILGIWGNPDVTGKSVATDIVSRKKSLPILYGLSQSDKLLHLYRRDNFNENDVDEAVSLLDALGARSYAENSEARYYERAIAALQQANPPGQAAAGQLMQFVETLFQRSY